MISDGTGPVMIKDGTTTMIREKFKTVHNAMKEGLVTLIIKYFVVLVWFGLFTLRD